MEKKQQSMRETADNVVRYSEDELLFLLGEELKKPLTVIQALSYSGDMAAIDIEARRALRTIDNILLYQKILKNQMALHFEPVHVGNTLHEVHAQLQPLAREFGCETEIAVQSGTLPVDADRIVLHAAIESLWQAMLGLTKKASPLYWELVRSSGSIRLLVTNTTIDSSKLSFNRKVAVGTSRQPMSGLAGPATDLVTARGLFESMGGLMKLYRNGNRAGFVVTLRPNPQLAFL